MTLSMPERQADVSAQDFPFALLTGNDCALQGHDVGLGHAEVWVSPSQIRKRCAWYRGCVTYEKAVS